MIFFLQLNSLKKESASSTRPWIYLKHITWNSAMESGQIIATSHDLGPQKVAKEGKSPYFREI